MIALGLLLTLSVGSDTLLVSADWLAERLDDPRIVVLHTGSPQGYDAGHVPGSRWIDIMKFHAHQGGSLPPVDVMIGTLEAAGVSQDSRIILTGVPLYPSMVYVALEYLGLSEHASILDGGLTAWRAAGYPLSQEAPTPTAGTLTPHVRSDVLVDAAWIAERLGQQNVTVLDARSAEEYAGTAEEPLPRTGHIPGARHLNWSDLTDESTGRFKSRADLRRLFAERGLDTDGTVVSYCTVGMRASEVYFAARLLGYRARIYAGSMTDWSPREDLPVTKGSVP